MKRVIKATMVTIKLKMFSEKKRQQRVGPQPSAEGAGGLIKPPLPAFVRSILVK